MIKILKKIGLFFASMFVLIILFGTINSIFHITKTESQNDIMNENNKTINKSIVEEKEDSKSSKKEKKILKTSSDEYFKFIDEINNDVINKYDYVTYYDVRKHLPYLNVGLYFDKKYSDEEAKNMSISIMEYYFDRLNENLYKSPFMAYCYDIVSVDIYNKGDTYNVPSNNIQYHVNELEKYNNYLEYKNR